MDRCAACGPEERFATKCQGEIPMTQWDLTELLVLL